MQTIPSTWKPGGTSNRSLWLNSTDSTPLIFIRIKEVSGGYIRLSNKNVEFGEEGGALRQYSDVYYEGFSGLDTNLNLFERGIGGTTQIGEITIQLNDGKHEGKKFTDMYTLDNLINASVDIWINFEESEALNIDNSLKIFTGTIYNYHYRNNSITLQVNPYSLLSQKKMPIRVGDLNDKYSVGWSTPEKYKNEVIPFAFGLSIHPCVMVDILSASNRWIRLVASFPSTSSGAGTVWYWDETDNRLKSLRTTLYSFTDTLIGDGLYAVRVTFNDIMDLPSETGQRKYLSPDTATKNLGPAIVKMENIKDQDLSTENMDIYVAPDPTPYVWHADLTYNSYVDVWTLNFYKDNFPQDIKFNVYFVADFMYTGQNESPKGYIKIKPDVADWNDVVIAPADWDYGGTDSDAYMIAYNIPFTFAEGQKYDSTRETLYTWQKNPRNIALDEWETATESTVDDISANSVEVKIQIKRTEADPPSTRSWACHEFALLIVPLEPTKQYFIYKQLDNDTLEDVIETIFDNFLELDSTDYVSFSNLAMNYQADGSMYEEKLTIDYIDQLVNEFGLLHSEDSDGKSKFIDLNSKAADYTITDDDIKMSDEGIPLIEWQKASTDIYSEFAVDYHYEIPSKKYQKTKYVNKDNHNLSYVTASTLQSLCRDAYYDFGSRKRWSLQCQFIRDDETAEEVLQKAVKFLTFRPTVVKTKTTWRLIDLEQGDQVAIDTDLYTGTHNFFVVGKHINPDYTIDFTFFECPW